MGTTESNLDVNNFIRRTQAYLKKKKSKAVPLHAMEAPRGKGSKAPTHS
jgi:hypothetical protein